MPERPRDPGAEPVLDSGFEVFDLSIQLGPGLRPWLSASSRLGHVHGIPRRDPQVPSLDDLLDSVYDFVDAVRFAEPEPDPDLARSLGHLVFGEPAVLELFQATRGAAADRGRELLVRILASPHLAVLPWELLPDPTRRETEAAPRFLTLAPDASVVRLARGRRYPVRREPLEPPLRLLVVLSSPQGRDPGDDSLSFDIYEEKQSLLAELLPLVEAGLLSVDVEDHPTLENLRRRIGGERRGYHLFHYLGHAQPDGLILEDAEGRRDDESGAGFTEVLRLCPDLRLAVFAGCETARAAGDPLALDAEGAVGWRHLLSLADRGVQECCPVVVGMQAVLPFRTERLFTRFFYQGLASGYSVAGAARLARGATRTDRHAGGDLLDWAVPVVFVGGDDPGPLLPRAAAGVPPRKPERHVLKIGLAQRETRFFARDVALRQALDVLGGDTPEHVLVVTGPRGVGKTLLVDRAFEELALETTAGPLWQLYLRLEELLPEYQQFRALHRGDLGTGARMSLGGLEAGAPLDRLCRLVAQLLARSDGRRRDPEPGWSPVEWWGWLVEEMASRRFLLAIDEMEGLVEMEEAIVGRLQDAWLAPRLARIQAEASAGGPDLAGQLDRLVEALSGESEHAPGSRTKRSNLLIEELGALVDLVGAGPPAGLGRVASDVLIEAAESLLSRLSEGEPVAAVLATVEGRAPSEEEREALAGDLSRLRAASRTLGRALGGLAERRSPSRLALTARDLPDDFLRAESQFVVRLGHLTWPETWRWIRRNLPGLLRYGEDCLARLWPRLGSELERWEELERRLLAASAPDAALSSVAAELAPRPRGRPASERPRRERPLRVAVAGPFLAGPQALAAAFTRLAAQQGVGGRAVATGDDDSGSLAVLVNEPSPFSPEGTAEPDAILAWIARVSRHQPDVILLDYGSPASLPLPEPHVPERQLLRSLRHRALLIAAGGNRLPGETQERVWVPGGYKEVLSIGPLSADLRLQPYAEWAPKLGKPDLFVVDELQGTPLADALAPEALRLADPKAPGTRGASFAALHAVAIAVLVWASLPDLTPRAVRKLLEVAARPVEGHGRPAPRRLDLADALGEARRRLVRATLSRGPCSQQALAALTGLGVDVVRRTLAGLIPAEVRRLPRGRLERYELVSDRAPA